MTVLARCAGLRASIAEASSSVTSSSSGIGDAGNAATAPAQKEHSFGSAARAERTKTCRRTRTIAAFFMALTASNKGTVFLNPAAGSNDELVAAATEAGLEIVRLRRELDIPAMVRERIAEGKRLFIAAGGDGTVNCVIQALVHSEAALGVIPLGTFNHFARDVGVPLTWRSASSLARKGIRWQVPAPRAPRHASRHKLPSSPLPAKRGP